MKDECIAGDIIVCNGLQLILLLSALDELLLTY